VPTHLFLSRNLGRYGFPEGHPLSVDRQGAFWRAARARGLDRKVVFVEGAAQASRGAIERFHRPEYVDRVMAASHRGSGYLDYGDTPAFPGCYEVAAHVVGAALEGARRIMAGEARRSFQPIGGLHHARRAAAAGFCVFNDPGVLIETLRAEHGVRRIAYVDIDVHHGDGVFYEFEDDPLLFIADIHEDGRHLYPGTGSAMETGKGKAAGTKLNIPLEPGAGDGEFIKAFDRVEQFVDEVKPELIILQCGADGLAGDPITHLQYTPKAHRFAADSLHQLAHRRCKGRIIALGGGGYNRANIGNAWTEVVRSFATDH